MVFSFTKLFGSVYLALLGTSGAVAAPWPLSTKYGTTRTRLVGRDSGLQLVTFHPASAFETFGVEGLDHPLATRVDGFDLNDAALSFVQSKLGISQDAVTLKSSFAGEVAQHAFVRQQHDGIPFANAVANVAFKMDGKVASFGSSFVTPSTMPSSSPSVSLEDAISTAEQTLSGTYNSDIAARLEFLALEDGSVALTHAFHIQNDTTGDWFDAFVDAHENKVLSITDFVARASFLVLPIDEEDLTEGFQTITDPMDTTASPYGWNSLDGTTVSTDTSGNNAVSWKTDETTGTTPESSTGLNFAYVQDPSADPTTATNVNAAVTNAFYVVNTIHDISYLYGFTEAAFNFQDNNFGKGGTAGPDRVTISVQDSLFTDNSAFTTLPDGLSGRMRMFLWTYTSPERDGALENDIVSHENTHGITNRMTGGGNADCLQSTESAGLGEGWSDAMADWLEQDGPDVADFVLGQYVMNNTAGIRSHPYSTSTTTNPLTYGSVAALDEVHDIGEIWANMLHNMLASLVDAHGFSSTARTDPTGSEGNTVFLHLFIDALPLQPCNPTFVTARDAIIQADANRYNGTNTCILWNAFASRGLGVNAANYVDDMTVPDGC
ncbi:metalloprotease [Stereum hirsutum FP-91666 SS1]|uniref:metalloprotease n=1 Tax=Stereum hirsutum (strain FP-91666) TaxID=721885 RepID=UPI0004449E34|nr:metalloprotease [Stereum hirsutum FP-91666 SS1]EIM86164.1 metalloprotease [Stereum hirsutum FP-91666 SS1]